MSWPLVTLGEVATFINGDRGKNYPSKGSFVESGVAFINAGSLSLEHKLIDSELNYITQDKYDSLRSGKVEKGDILFCLRGSLGKFAVVENDIKGAIASSLVIIRANHKIALSYLKHYLGSVLCVREIDTFENGAAQPNLSATDLKSFKIPLPPLDEQKRIAEILDKADAIRQKRKQAIALADEFLRSVFLEMFGDPVTNPKGWEVKELAEVASSQLGKMLSKHAKEGINSKKYIRNANVRWREIDVSDLSEMDFTEKEINKFALLDGDLLVCEGGEVGRCAIWTGQESDCYYQKALHRVRVKPDILTPYYLQEYFYWMARKGGLLHSVSEVTFSHLTGERLKTLKVPLPPIKLQKQFEAIYGGYIETLGRLGLAARTDNDLFNALSQKAFSGQL